MFQVLGQYDESSQEYMDLYAELDMLYEQKNMGLWLTASDLGEMETYCADNVVSLDMSLEECLATIAMISTAGVSYCNEDCKMAVDGNF